MTNEINSLGRFEYFKSNRFYEINLSITLRESAHLKSNVCICTGGPTDEILLKFAAEENSPDHSLNKYLCGSSKCKRSSGGAALLIEQWTLMGQIDEILIDGEYLHLHMYLYENNSSRQPEIYVC